jgi:hypothetical protein
VRIRFRATAQFTTAIESSSVRLLGSDTCRKPDAGNSAIAAIGQRCLDGQLCCALPSAASDSMRAVQFCDELIKREGAVLTIGSRSRSVPSANRGCQRNRKRIAASALPHAKKSSHWLGGGKETLTMVELTMVDVDGYSHVK